MQQFCSWTLLGLSAAALIGCATHYQSHPDKIHVQTPPANLVSSNAEPFSAGAPIPQAAAPTIAEPQNLWVLLNQWQRTNHFALRQISTGPTPRFELTSSAGLLQFTIGTQTAHWNGCAFMLGFAPRLVHGLPSLNDIDLQKGFLPLLLAHPCPKTKQLIAIDPGHGGKQTGTRSVDNGHFEKEFTLDWALRLQTLLIQQGWKVCLTRTDDSDVPLPNRVALAERVQPDLFLSLHFNSCPKPEEFGIETYCLTPAGAPSHLTRGADEMMVFPNNSFDIENFCWAMHLHQSLVKIAQAADRGVRRARFMAVLRTQSCPAVLIEGGYLSNHAEAKLIATPEYRQKLAQAVAEALTAAAPSNHTNSAALH
jgi:N-acetylmuramoyl-L-alanine amidase